MSEEKSQGAEPLRGVVKWFNDAKGFGFIEHTSGKDVFVHYSVIDSSGFKTLKDGEEVLYELKEGPKGLHAVAVVRANAPASESQPDEAKSETQDKQDGRQDSEPQNARPGKAGRLAAEIVSEVITSKPSADAEEAGQERNSSDTNSAGIDRKVVQ